MEMNTLTPIATGTLDIPRYGELLRRTTPKQIENLQENRRAVAMIELLVEKDRTPEEDVLLELLAGLVETFERNAFEMPQSTPRERLQFLLDENGLRPADVADLMGGRSCVSYVLSGKREISKDQARKLAQRFNVPPAIFIF